MQNIRATIAERPRAARAAGAALAAALLLPGASEAARRSASTHSSTIALYRGDRQVAVVNTDANSLSIIRVRDKSGDLAKKVAEIPVGREPRCVAVDAKGRFAFVANTVSGTVSVVSLSGPSRFEAVTDIPVGTEPRGCAFSPNGKRLFVANHTAGTVSVIDPAQRRVVGTIEVGGNPTAIAVSDDGDRDDNDETVFVTQFFSELVEGKQQPFDDARQGIVHAFSSGGFGSVERITLSPLANSGFDADRSKFCTKITAGAHSDVYCPDPEAAVANDAVLKDVQGAFPNLLNSAIVRRGKLYLANIGAAPEPPVKFNVNVQALVNVVDVAAREELADLTTNLNAEVKAETAPAEPTKSLDKLFGNDIVAVGADRAGTVFLVVSQGGNFAFRASLDAAGKLVLGTPVVRFQSGNIPNGVAVSADGKRAYLNNEVGYSVTAIDLAANAVIARDIPSTLLPEPGTFDHAVLAGKLAFFTALGTPDDGLTTLPIRDIVPLEFRGKASDNAWSSCNSCHPNGLTDNVTWIFAEGPRNTISLDAFFAKDNPGDQRISNWSAIRGSIADFNNNSRGVQGGKGFAGDPPNPDIYNHGATVGASDALDLQTLWVQTIRAPILPAAADAEVGRAAFETSCASCHGGAKWTKSQVLYLDNPAFTSDPNGNPAGVPRDPGVVSPAAGQIQRYGFGSATIDFMNDVGSFDPDNPLELRGVAAGQGKPALGAVGFNVPSLLGVAYTAPYFHDGSATALDDVFARHTLPGGGSIAATLSAQEERDLKTFLATIDGATETFLSDADRFRDAVAGTD